MRVWSSCRTSLWFTQLCRMESALRRQTLELLVMSFPCISGAVLGKRVSCQVGLHWHDSDGSPRATYGPWLLRSRHWCVVKRSAPATLSPAVLFLCLACHVALVVKAASAAIAVTRSLSRRKWSKHEKRLMVFEVVMCSSVPLHFFYGFCCIGSLLKRNVPNEVFTAML